MGNAYNIKLKKGDVEIEVFGPDKEFVANKFKESVLVAFDKPDAFKEVVNQLPVQVAEQAAQESANIEPVQTVEAAPEQAAVEISNPEPILVAEQAVQAAEPVAEVVSHPDTVVSEVTQAVETIQTEMPKAEEPMPIIEGSPAQEVVVNEAMQAAEPVAEVVVAPVEAAPVVEALQPPQLGKSALANVAQVSDDALSKVYSFKKDGFKAHKEFAGTTSLKQINMTKLVLIASEYVNGVASLSGKAIGKHMKAIGTGNLATNLKRDSGIIKDKNFYRLNDAGKQSALELIRTLSKD